MSGVGTVPWALKTAWNAAAAGGKILQEFVATTDGPAGAWRAGDGVTFGVRRDEADGILAYEALNRSTGRPISPEIRERTLGPRGFLCQYHPFRELRPGADAGARPGRCDFYCDDPLAPLSMLRRVMLLRLELPNAVWNAYPNAAPFHHEGHCLWIPADGRSTELVLPHQPQWLTKEVIEDVIALAVHPVSRGAVLFFNGLGAGASVNHLHIHSMIHQPPLAIVDARLVGCGQETVLDDYPARGLVFDLRIDRQRSRLSSWVLWMQRRTLPLNLILCDHRAYLFARSTSSPGSSELPGCRIAAIELGGKLITGSPLMYSQMSESALSSALQAATVCPTQFIDRLMPMESHIPGI